MTRTLAAIALLAVVTGCSQSAQQSSQSSQGAQAQTASPAPISNPIDFPLYQQSTVIGAHDFKQSAGSATMSGTEVIAQNAATLSELSSWIKGVDTAPPAGYTVLPSSTGYDTARAKAQSMGMDFAVFTHSVNGQKRALVVLAVDPKIFDEKAGMVLTAISKFHMLPQSMRDSIDSQVKSRTGYTVSDALNPNTPLGGAVAAVNTLHDSGQRGIVLIDGAKQ